jgi:catechol 2,3-dioxygenase-like lactoylglutathione lyase family enzyme
LTKQHLSDRFHHLFIAPADFEASLLFYRDSLGWAVTRTWGGNGTVRGALLSGGGMELVLASDPAYPAGRPILHLDIHDIDARFKTLPRGVDVVTPPEDTHWGTRWFVVRDPDGNLIAFEEVHSRGR